MEGETLNCVLVQFHQWEYEKQLKALFQALIHVYAFIENKKRSQADRVNQIKISVLISIYYKLDSSLKILHHVLNAYLEETCKAEWQSFLSSRERPGNFNLPLPFIIFCSTIKNFYFDLPASRISSKNEELAGWLSKGKEKCGWNSKSTAIHIIKYNN